jgi:hypothetical protein
MEPPCLPSWSLHPGRSGLAPCHWWWLPQFASLGGTGSLLRGPFSAHSIVLFPLHVSLQVREERQVLAEPQEGAQPPPPPPPPPSPGLRPGSGPSPRLLGSSNLWRPGSHYPTALLTLVSLDVLHSREGKHQACTGATFTRKRSSLDLLCCLYKCMQILRPWGLACSLIVLRQCTGDIGKEPGGGECSDPQAKGLLCVHISKGAPTPYADPVPPGS